MRYVIGFDTQFIYFALPKGDKIRYDKFRDYIEGDVDQVVEMYAPVIRMHPLSRQDTDVARSAKDFSNVRLALESQGINVIEAPQKPTVNGGMKSSDDQRLMIKLAVACMRLKPDFLVLVAADGDYAPLVWALREEGIRTKLITDPAALATQLKVACYSVSNLHNVLRSIDGETDADGRRERRSGEWQDEEDGPYPDRGEFEPEAGS